MGPEKEKKQIQEPLMMMIVVDFFGIIEHESIHDFKNKKEVFCHIAY